MNTIFDVTDPAIGAVGDGVADNAAALSRFVKSGAPRGDCSLYFPGGVYRISTNLTLPRSIQLGFAPGASLLLDGGVTMTVNGSVAAGPHQIVQGAGAIRFGPGSSGRLVPQWWGAKGDDAADDTVALQACLDSAANGPRHVLLPPGVYRTRTLTLGSDGMVIEGVGSSYGYNVPSSRSILKFLPGSGAHGVNLIIVEHPNPGTLFRDHCQIRDLEIDGQSQVDFGINCCGATLIERVTVQNCKGAGIRLGNATNSTHIDACSLTFNAGWGLWVSGPATTPWTVSRTNIRRNAAGGIYVEGGACVSIRDCVVESNGGPGFRAFRPAVPGWLDQFILENVWFENNAVGIEIDAASPAYKPGNFVFRHCRCVVLAPYSARYLDIQSVHYCQFDACYLLGSTAPNAIVLGGGAAYVERRDLNSNFPWPATGNRAFAWDRKTTGEAGLETTGAVATSIGIGLPGAPGSTDPHILDAYEEGTFGSSITCGSGGTISTATVNALRYTRVGRLVHVHGTLRVSAVNRPAGVIRVALPFPVAASAESDAAASIQVHKAAPTWIGAPVGYAAAGSSFLHVNEFARGTLHGPAAKVQVGTEINVSVTYGC